MISVDTKAKAWIATATGPDAPGAQARIRSRWTATATSSPTASRLPCLRCLRPRHQRWLGKHRDRPRHRCVRRGVHPSLVAPTRTTRHPRAIRLLITADSGGSNNPRYWTWKKRPHAFAHAPASGTLIRNSLPCPTLTVRNPGSCRPGFRSVRHRLSDRWICGPGRPR